MCISYLVYGQIWLNLIWDVRQFFHLSYIRKFLKNIDPIFAFLPERLQLRYCQISGVFFLANSGILAPKKQKPFKDDVFEVLFTIFRVKIKEFRHILTSVLYLGR
jgi:hypothetical protein